MKANSTARIRRYSLRGGSSRQPLGLRADKDADDGFGEQRRDDGNDDHHAGRRLRRQPHRGLGPGLLVRAEVLADRGVGRAAETHRGEENERDEAVAEAVGGDDRRREGTTGAVRGYTTP